MKTYEAIFNEEKVDGVFGISLVHDPAMEGVFVALKKQEEIHFAEIDVEQRILMGLVLEPNKPIYRNQNGEEFNIVFNEQTVKELSHGFFKSNSHKNSTVEHDENSKIEGVTFVESWIVEDSEKDKSANFGFNYPKGSWIATMKVDNDEIWNDYVKTGKVKGFSIDAMLSLKEVNLKSNININMSEIKKEFQSLTDRLLVALSLKEKEIEIKLGTVKSSDGNITFEYQGDVLEAGVAIVAIGEDGSKIPVPVGQYELEDGSILIVEQEGIISSVGQPEKEEEASEMESDMPSMSDIENAIKSIMIKYSEQNKKNEDFFKTEITELKKQIFELSEQPATNKINSQPTVNKNKNLSLTERLNNKL